MKKRNINPVSSSPFPLLLPNLGVHHLLFGLLSPNWLLPVSSHNLFSIWWPELSGTQDSFVFSGSYCIQNESKHTQMAFLVSTSYSWSTFHSTDLSQGPWGSSYIHMQMTASPRQDLVPVAWSLSHSILEARMSFPQLQWSSLCADAPFRSHILQSS